MYNQYRLVSFSTDQTNEKILEQIINLCSNAEKETDMPAHTNMDTDSWETKNHTLLYLLTKTDRFKSNNGLFSILYDDSVDSERIIACSGVYRSSFDINVAIGGVRTWVIPEYRTKYLISKYITPDQLSWCRNNELKVFVLTFNEYNRKLMLILNRSGKYLNQRNDHIFGVKRDLTYQNMEILDRMSYIQGVNQYVMFTKIDSNYDVTFPDPV